MGDEKFKHIRQEQWDSYQRNRASAASDTSGPRDGSRNELLQNELSNNSFLAVGRVLNVVGGLYDIQVTVGGSGPVSAVYLPGLTHELAGGGCFTLPNIGDRFLGVKFRNGTGPIFILGTYPERGAAGGLGGWLVGPEIDAFTEDVELSSLPTDPVGIENRNNHRPEDVMAGDQGWCTEDGAALALLRGGIALIKATELAQIKLLADDDLVQILSRNFQHHTDLGEYNLLNDEGEVTAEWVGSGHFFEALGQVAEDVEIGKQSDEPKKGQTYYNLPPDKVTATGNWRFRILVGYLGGVLKVFVTQPDEEPTSLPENFVPGVAEIQLTEEGALKVESAKEVLIRKVSKVLAPRKLTTVDDPMGDTKVPTPGETVEGQVGPPTPALPEYSPDREVKEFAWDTEHPGGRMLEEEDASTWNRQFDHRRFLDHTKDWEYPSAENAPKPRKTVPPEKAEVVYTEVVSTFHLRDDGSAFLESGGHAGLEATADGNLIFFAPKDAIFQVGRDIVGLAGKDINLRANENIDLSATKGDVRAKAENNLHMYTKKRGIFLQTESEFQGPGGDGEDALTGGIVLKSAKAPIAFKAEGAQGHVRLDAEKNVVISAKEEAKFSSLKKMQLGTSDNLELKVAKKLTIKVDQAVKMQARQWQFKVDTLWNVDCEQFYVKCSKGEIEGSGPNSVKSSHMHTFTTPHGIQQTEDIKPQLTANKTVTAVAGLKDPLYDQPSVDDKVVKYEFTFRSKYGVSLSSEKTYEAPWQLASQGSSWLWPEDERQGTEPWPGSSYTERYEYEPTGGIDNIPGQFIQIKRKFKLP